MNTREQLKKTYQFSDNTIDFLFDTFSCDTVLSRLEDLTISLGHIPTEEEVLQYVQAALIDLRNEQNEQREKQDAELQVAQPSTWLHESTSEDEDYLSLWDTIISYILLAVVTLIGSVALDIYLKLNLKYALYFSTLVLLFYMTFTLFSNAKEGK